MFFSERGETKLDLVRHYLRLDEPLMRTMGGRPVLLQRFPSGAGGPSFFQKRIPDSAPEWLETTTVSTPNGTTSRALVAADLAHIAWAVNLGCLGFHVWPYLAADAEHADELRLDLDPQPGTDFSHVRAAAAETKALLDALGIAGYPKTTGNRGLHVYVRLEPRWDSYQVRAAAVAAARELERRRPDLITAQWWKEDRGERVFVDYNQNAPHKTVFGAWCVRARLGRAGLHTAAVGRDRRDPPRRPHDRVASRPHRGGRRPVARHERRPAIPRAASRAARARPCRRAHGRAVAARLPEAARRATSRLAQPREEDLIRKGCSSALPVDEEAAQGAEGAPGAARDIRQSHEPMGERLAAGAAVELFCADRLPELVDCQGRIVRDLIDGQLEMLGPESQPGAPARSGSWVTRFISVSLKSECSFRLADPRVSQVSSMIPTLAWT